MNGAHWHLVLNHIPVIGIWFGIAFLIFGLIRRKEILTKSALWIFLLLALITIPAFLTGEAAEEIVEKIPVVSENVIHDHEETAELAFLALLIVGFISLLGLVLPIFTRKRPAAITFLLLLGSVIAAVLMALTANTGGQIRHPEIKSGITQNELLDDYRGFYSPDTTVFDVDGDSIEVDDED